MAASKGLHFLSHCPELSDPYHMGPPHDMAVGWHGDTERGVLKDRRAMFFETLGGNISSLVQNAGCTHQP